MCIVCLNRALEKPLHLITLAQRGDRQAFAALFEQYKNLVYKTAYLMLGDRNEAEDALQEVFVQVYKSLDRYDPARAVFSTWLYRLTINHCSNRRRSRRRLTLPWDDELAAVVKVEFPSMRLAEEEAMQQAIQGLSSKQRAVIILRYFWDLPYAEIAEVLDLPLGTVKSRINLALRTLRQILEKQESFPVLATEEEA